jgi:hypothetical protein
MHLWVEKDWAHNHTKHPSQKPTTPRKLHDLCIATTPDLSR